MFRPRVLTFGLNILLKIMRIDKFICDIINITRTQAKSKVSSGAVTVNGSVIRSSSVKVNEITDEICVDGRKLVYKKHVYIMMNKPSGVLSASTDRACTTAIDLLKPEDKRHDLFIAGRLDKNTTGFLLITNDGDFAHSVLSPKKHIVKTYFVTLRDNDFFGYETAFKNGVVLDDGYKCKSAEFIPNGDNTCYLKISEGKFHQIKRMFAALGNEVTALSRVAMGGLKLDQNLSFGQYRYLTDKEVNEIFMQNAQKAPSDNCIID